MDVFFNILILLNLNYYNLKIEINLVKCAILNF